MSTEHPAFVDEANISEQTRADVVNHFATDEELVDFLVDDGDLSELSGIGPQTSSLLWGWFEEEYPEKDRKRREQSEAYCLDFTTDHGLEDPTDDEFHFAFICPRCDHTNPLVGDPSDFGGRPFHCVGCGWVPLLDSEAMTEFRDEHYPDRGGDA